MLALNFIPEAGKQINEHSIRSYESLQKCNSPISRVSKRIKTESTSQIEVIAVRDEGTHDMGEGDLSLFKGAFIVACWAHPQYAPALMVRPWQTIIAGNKRREHP